MIATLNGRLVYADPVGLSCVVECGGVGYFVTLSASSFSKLPLADEEKGELVRLYTHMVVREDAMELYGFLDRDELRSFKLLITVSGVGPKAAIAILSLYSPEELSEHIANEDVKLISKAQGVGSKIAGRVVLELKDKIQKEFPTFAGSAEKATEKVRVSRGAKNSPEVSDARDALLVLGYSQAEVNSALASCDTDTKSDNIIRQALAILSAR